MTSSRRICSKMKKRNNVLKPKQCKNPECELPNRMYTPTRCPDSGYCSPRCLYQHKPPKPRQAINKKSDKRKSDDKIYTPTRKEFLARPENHFCFIDGCGKRATTIEHTMGREGFADDWARYNNISLYIDVRFFAPCCWDHNGELENNPELSKQYQYSKIHGGRKD